MCNESERVGENKNVIFVFKIFFPFFRLLIYDKFSGVIFVCKQFYIVKKTHLTKSFPSKKIDISANLDGLIRFKYINDVQIFHFLKHNQEYA